MKFEYAIAYIRNEDEVFIYDKYLDDWVNLEVLNDKKFTIKELLNSNFSVLKIKINSEGFVYEKFIDDDEPGVIHHEFKKGDIR